MVGCHSAFPFRKSFIFRDGRCAHVPIGVLDRAEFLLWNGIATGSHKTYDSGIRMYLRCMSKYRIAPFPATEAKLSIFCQWRVFERPVKWHTLRSNFTAIRSYHVEIGERLVFFDMPGLQRVMRGVKRFLGISTDNRLAITPDILGRMFAFLDRNTIVGSLYRSAFSIALFGLLRCSEFAWSAKDDPAKLLTRSSVLFEPDMSGVKINVNASKTDFFRKGCCIRIGCRCDPSKPNRICPVHELKHFMDSVPGLPNEPLFRLAGAILNRDMVTKMLDALCDRLGLDKKLFKSHSFRKGGATALKNAGVPDSVIKVIGRWLSNSYRLYVQYSDGDLFKFSDLMF